MNKIEKLIREVMENMPEYSISLDCGMWDYKGCKYRFQDFESCEVYHVDLEKLLKGYTIMRQKIADGKLHCGLTLDDATWFDGGSWDAGAVDALVQCAIFGDVIYG